MALEHPLRRLDHLVARLPQRHSDEGLVQVRMLPGVFRTIALLEGAGLPPHLFLGEESEKNLGLQDGVMSPGGLPGFIGSLDAVRISSRGPTIGPNRLDLFVDGLSFNGAGRREVPRTLAARFETLGLDPIGEGGTFWKDSISPSFLRHFCRLIERFPKLWVGPSRSVPFARALGIDDRDILIVPDYGAFRFTNELTSEIEARLHGLPRPPLIIHSAGLAGAQIACNLSLRGMTIGVLDVGLASAVTDIEYLAYRPWFRENRRRLLAAARIVSVSQPNGLRLGRERNRLLANARLRREARNLSRWPEIRKLSLARPAAALVQLQDLLDSVHLVQTPLLDAVLLTWQHFVAGSSNPALLERCSRSVDRAEPLLASIAISDLQGDSAHAASILEKTRTLFPRDQRLDDWARVVTLSALPTEKHDEWRALLYKFGRQDLGSSLSWSLEGDLPSGVGHPKAPREVK